MVHRVVLGVFSRALADIFLGLDKEDESASIIVPLISEEVKDILDMLYDDTKCGRNEDFKTLQEVCLVLDIDIHDIGGSEEISHETVEENMSEFPIEEIPHEKYTHEDETETQNFELDDSETPYEDIFDEDKTTMI